MKKLIGTDLNGAPFSLDYLKFLNDKTDDVQNGFGSFVQLCILSGCQLTQGIATWQIAQGWVILAGEVCFVPAADTGLANASNPQANLYWNINESAAAPSPHQYHDLTVKTDTLERIAFLQTGVTLLSLAQTPKYEQAIANKLRGAWNIVGTGGQPAFEPNWSYYGDRVRFRVDLMGMVTISGDAFYNIPYVADTSLLIFTLPIGYRPLYQQRFNVLLVSFAPCILSIYPNGQVVFYSTAATAGGINFSLSGIMFYID